MMYTGFLVTSKPLGRPFCRPSIIRLPGADDRCRLVIILFQKFVHPLVRPVSIVIERKCQIHRSGEIGGVAPGFTGDTCNLGPLLGPGFRVGGDWQPSVKRAPDLTSAAQEEGVNLPLPTGN